MTESYFIKPIEYAEGRPDKAFKHTFLQTDRVLAGLNSLLQGQSQPLHDHPDQDKFYFVLEGTGLFTVGDTSQVCTAGELILAPAGVPHGVVNEDRGLLTFLTIIAPFPN